MPRKLSVYERAERQSATSNRPCSPSDRVTVWLCQPDLAKRPDLASSWGGRASVLGRSRGHRCNSRPAAETIQVKVTKGNITLRSADIVEAINNAWLNQQRNRDRAIRYRLLTNASIGMEQGDPIGLGIPGLVLWERARSAIDEPARLADTHRIRQFLLNEGRVSAAVQAFSEKQTERRFGIG